MDIRNITENALSRWYCKLNDPAKVDDDKESGDGDDDEVEEKNNSNVVKPSRANANLVKSPNQVNSRGPSCRQKTFCPQQILSKSLKMVFERKLI